ncbi:hypothetical protein F503_06124 [Ophiostoma piceae UAMH 11346]|uniref:Uncharacterized protein n=1 Tax=Ophiostoma piceae (strain UAMH 11346) TaxID=1262450 RepID=S3C7Q8_OPHP1|nr:hypothetical protein F503_06124 [Ophiostoma piceae UAMH 11346]
MPRPPEPGCKPPSSPPTGCFVDAASGFPDEASELMVTTRSMTSMDSSSIMSDEYETSKTFGPLMPQPVGKSDSLSESTSLILQPSSSPHDDSLSATSFQSPQTTQQHTASSGGMPHHDASQQAKNESILTASADAGVDADSRSSDLSGSFTDSCSNSKDAEVGRKPRINRFLSSTSGRLVPVEGVIGSVHEHIRPNAETILLFSFTPITGTGRYHKQSSRSSLIGSLENVPVDKGPPAASQKSIKLRRRRCVDVRALTFDDWRPCTDSQAKCHQEESFQATQTKDSSDTALLETGSRPDAKTTADRRRFDFLVSRLQQKLSERSQGSFSGSIKAPSISEASRQVSHAGSAHSNKPPSRNTREPSLTPGHVGSKGSSSNDLLGAEDKAHANNEYQDQPQLEAPFHAQQQSAPSPHQPFPAQFQGNIVQSADCLPHPFPFLMQQLPQYPGPWNSHNDQALSLGQPTFPTTAYYNGYPSPSPQPPIAAWPHAPGAPSHFGTYHYVGHPQETVPCLPLPHYKPPFSVPTQSNPPRSPKKSRSRGHIPFIPLNAIDQQKIEEHIEFLKATVPSFAMVSKRRQRQRWLRENTNLENQQRRQQEDIEKSMHNHLPMPPQPVNCWDPQVYQQLQQQYYHHGYIPAVTASQASMHGPPPLSNPLSYANIPWSNLQ